LEKTDWSTKVDKKYNAGVRGIIASSKQKTIGSQRYCLGGRGV